MTYRLSLLLLFAAGGCSSGAPRNIIDTANTTDVAANTVVADGPATAPNNEELSKLQGMGDASGWKIIGIGGQAPNRNFIAVNTKAIVRKSDAVRQMWDAHISENDGDTSYYMALNEYDCPQRLSKSVMIVTRTKGGSSGSDSTAKYSPVIPGTQGNQAFAVACDKADNVTLLDIPAGIDPIVYIRRAALGARTVSDAVGKQDMDRMMNRLLIGPKATLRASESIEISRGFAFAVDTGKSGIADTDQDRLRLRRLILASVKAPEARRKLIAFISA